MSEAEAIPFASFSMPRLRVKGNQAEQYFVFKNAREYVTVNALCAAEAIEKSEVARPFKVVNAAFAGDDILAREMVEKTEARQETRITHEEDLPAFYTADLLEQPGDHPSFEEYSLSAFAELMRTRPAPEAEPAVAFEEMPLVLPPTPFVEEAAAAPEEHDSFLIATSTEAVEEAPVPDRELTAEEVEKLMRGE